MIRPHLVNKMPKDFIPAVNKLEAVARISSITNSGPETLGPGSKERRSVLENLANGLGLNSSASSSKQELARNIAIKLNVDWNQHCESTGQTITLKGLNLLLEGALYYFENLASLKEIPKLSMVEEIELISAVVTESIPRKMDGKSCVIEMKDAESSNWKQTEWQGWYFEFKAIPALINTLGGGPKLIGPTKFDYSLVRTWDLKTHSMFGKRGPVSPNKACQLNDQVAMKQAVHTEGLGLIILSGEPHYDQPDFSDWHKSLRGKSGPVRRQLKNAFTPKSLEFFFIDNVSKLENALEQKILTEFKQGRQPGGQPRAPKYSLNLEIARDSDLKIHSLDLS